MDVAHIQHTEGLVLRHRPQHGDEPIGAEVNFVKGQFMERARWIRQTRREECYIRFGRCAALQMEDPYVGWRVRTGSALRRREFLSKMPPAQEGDR